MKRGIEGSNTEQQDDSYSSDNYNINNKTTTDVEPSANDNQPSSEVDKAPKASRCLDKLARLFEMSSQGCAAVALANTTIVIADNAISAGSRGLQNNEGGCKVQLIRTVMQYFADFTNEEEEYAVPRAEVFEAICIKRLRGESSGHISSKLSDNILRDIAKDLLAIYQPAGGWRPEYITKIEKYEKPEKPLVAESYEICALLARDFIKIEKYIRLIQNVPADAEISDDARNLITALQGQENQCISVGQGGGIKPTDRGRVQQGDEAGYVIAFIDINGVHAEAKLIEYLIFTGFLEIQEQQEETDQQQETAREKIYVGISKLSCAGCQQFISAINKIAKLKVEIVYRGAHELTHKWTQPIICDQNILEDSQDYYEEETPNQSDIAPNKRKYESKPCLHLVSDETVIALSEIAPSLDKAKSQSMTNIPQVEYSFSSPYSSSSAHEEEATVTSSSQVHNKGRLLQQLMNLYNNQSAVNKLVLQLSQALEPYDPSITDPDQSGTDTIDVPITGEEDQYSHQ